MQSLFVTISLVLLLSMNAYAQTPAVTILDPSNVDVTLDTMTSKLLIPEDQSTLDQIAEALNINSEILNEEQLKLKAELLLKESILLSMEQMDKFNQATGLNSEYGHLVAIPNVVLSLYVISKGVPVSNHVVNYLTPENKMKSFMKQIDAIDLKIKEAKKAVAISKKALASVIENNLDAVEIAKTNILLKENALNAVIGQRYLLLQTKPGVFYKAGRLTRGLVKSTVFLGAATVTIAMVSDLVLLWLPEDRKAFEAELRQDVLSLESLLNSPITLQ